MPMADFDGPVLPEAIKAKHAASREKNDALRNYLKVWETLPVQLPNSYGESSYVNNTDETVWKEFSEPTETGAMYVTELCSAKPQRRAIGMNRVLRKQKSMPLKITMALKRTARIRMRAAAAAAAHRYPEFHV